MSFRRIFLVAIALAVVSVGAFQVSVFGQSDEIVVKVTSVEERPVRFRGAIMFREGGLQLVDRQTPFEIRGHGGVTLGMFERLGEGPEIRVELSAGQSSASGTAERVIVGHDVVRGVATFARTF